MEPIFIDIETQSCCDLKKYGTRRYIKHPSSRLMSLVAKIDGAIHVWLPTNPPLASHEVKQIHVGPTVPGWLQTDRLCVGHNAHHFDGPFLVHHYGLALRWYDTMPAARASGLPGSLDAIGIALGFGGKDGTGKTAMHMLSVAKVKGGEPVYPVGTPALWSQMLMYNIRDVEITERIYQEVRGKEERDVIRVDKIINERGIKVDVDWLSDLLAMWNELEAKGGDRLADLTNGVLTRKTAASVPKFKKWLASQGVQLGSLARKEIEIIYEDPEAYFGDCDQAALIVEVLKTRQSLTRAMKSKLARIDELLEADHRIRDTIVYHAAHTGRFGGRGVQPQNLSKGARIDVEAIINGPRTLEHVRQIAGDNDVDDVLAAVVRPVFISGSDEPLGIADYAAIEARVLAWFAGEDWLLQAFADPKRDVYCEFGAKIFGRPITKKDVKERFIAKECVLGMGYGMSGRRFAVSCKQKGLDLEANGLTADGLIALYRSLCPNVVKLWHEVWRAAKKHEECCGGRIRFVRDNAHMVCQLPSGRAITYRHCRFERGVPGYVRALGLEPFEADLLLFRHPHGFDVELYGAKLVENIVQGAARDILCDALIDLERQLFSTVLHVHDEIVTENGSHLDAMCNTMSIVPEWAEGLPLRVHGFTCPRYVKEAWKGSHEVEYMNGVQV